jgi:NADPH:quinone reductase-like Zn-dependent oxidoreductase
MQKDDLEFLAGAKAAAQLTPLIDRRFSLAELPEAIRYSESGRARGKIIIDVAGPE